MADSFRIGSYTLSIIADTSERFSDFAPYVASVNNGGVVAFQATLKGGGSGVYTGNGGAAATIVDSRSGPFREISSHPDINTDGSTCFYASLKSGGSGVFRVRRGEIVSLADSCGTLGPTMNERGTVAFRATLAAGRSGIFTASAGEGGITTIAETSGPYAAFHGLPVINSAGAVAFRADLTRGGHGIYVAVGERITPIVETGAIFSDLGLFPILSDAGTVAFCATLRAGGSGVFAARNRRIETIIDTRAPFESFRGVLLNGAGTAVFYATPRAPPARLGIFTGPDPLADCLLSLGSPFLGSTIADFALNPVSINDAGQLAIRVRLADHRQFILRADPAQP